jgi:hypothetical protein
MTLDGENDHMTVLARPYPKVLKTAGLEPGEFGGDSVMARAERSDGRHTVAVGLPSPAAVVPVALSAPVTLTRAPRITALL